MQIDPLVEWQRLTETYSKMYDAELLQLAADSADLTEQAQQALGDEMRKRGLSLSHPPGMQPEKANETVERAAAALGVDPEASGLDPDTPDASEEEGAAPEYTWKTVLCECETMDQAQQVSATLGRSGIESWVEGQGSYSRYGATEVRYPRVIVPADRLEQAREIAAKPIPKEIVEDLETEVPEFEAPVCPKCGAADPILESADPVNSWFCEACEHEWTDPAETDAPNP